MHYNNVIRIEENSSLLHNVQRRKLYKLCPFHIEDKESWADAMIIESLINIRDFIEIEDEDQIYFITRNYKDFSKGNSKTEREIIHPHIEEQLIKNQLNQLFHYRSLYTKTLIDDFSEETKEANIYQSLMEEAEHERRAMLEDLRTDLHEMERESVGLSSVSSDETYIERISESDEIQQLLITTDSLLSSLSVEIENVIENYNQFVDNMNIKPLDDLILDIQTYNAQSPFLKISYDNRFTEEEVRDAIIEFVNDNLCSVDVLELSLDSIRYKDYFEIGELFNFNDIGGNTFMFSIEEQLDPRDDDSDSIFLSLKKNENQISYGEIEVYYGYINFNEDGGASHGSIESINYQLEKIISDFKELVKENVDSINKISGDLNKMQAILSI